MPSLIVFTSLFAILGAVAGQSPTPAPSQASQAPANHNWPPLSEIRSGAKPQATPGPAIIYPPGSRPTNIPNAPLVPPPPSLNAYPARDKIPPTDSPEVRRWVSQINWDLVPKFSKTNGSSCAKSPQGRAEAAQRCWWSCNGCTRKTDVTECSDKMNWGLTFDDGPSPHSGALLNYLNSVNVTATFYLVGSRVIERPEVVVAEYMSGQQLAGHSWSHNALTSLTNEEIVAELGWTSKAIRDVVGVTPNTFRPPYGDIDDRVRAIAAQMGLTPVLWTQSQGKSFDTFDWDIPNGKTSGEDSLHTFQGIVSELAPGLSTGFITLQHDLYQETVDLAAGYLIPWALQSKYLVKSVIECVRAPLSDAYIETSNNLTATLITSVPSGTFFQASVGPQATPSTTSAPPAENTTVPSQGPPVGGNLIDAGKSAGTVVRADLSLALLLSVIAATFSLA